MTYGDDTHREAMCDPDYAEGAERVRPLGGMLQDCEDHIDPCGRCFRCRSRNEDF